MNQWQNDKEWSDKFIPEIKQILGSYLIGEASLEDDAFRNTDLIVLSLDGSRIACRVRAYLQGNGGAKHPYHQLGYEKQFTIRSRRLSGNKTELAKIVEGWGDFFFYGFSSEDGTRLEHWTLCDLNVFRLDFSRMLYCGNRPKEYKNYDNSSYFVVFDFSSFGSNFVVGASGQ